MGFPRELFLDKPIDEEFLCTICQDVLQDPVMIETCEHIFCSSCLSEWSHESRTCPLDRDTFASFRPPQRSFINLLNRLRLTCKHTEYGCTVGVVTLGGLADHDGQCQGRPELVRECAMDCGASFKVADAAAHNCVSYLKARLKSRDEEIDQLNARLSERGQSHFQAIESRNRPTPYIVSLWKMPIERAFEILNTVGRMLVSSGAASFTEQDLKSYVKCSVGPGLRLGLDSEWRLDMYESGREPREKIESASAEYPGMDIAYRNWTIRILDMLVDVDWYPDDDD